MHTHIKRKNRIIIKKSTYTPKVRRFVHFIKMLTRHAKNSLKHHSNLVAVVTIRNVISDERQNSLEQLQLILVSLMHHSNRVAVVTIRNLENQNVISKDLGHPE